MKRIVRNGQLSAEEAAKYTKVREAVKKDFPVNMNDEIKVGDKVAVQDRRDGVIVNYTTVEAIAEEEGKLVASVAAGYRVSMACLLKVPPETNGHQWEWKQIVYGSCAGSWRCKKCLTVFEMGCGKDMECDNGASMKRKG